MKKTINFTIIIILFLTLSAIAWSNDNIPVATNDAYFDIATGHKYIKNFDATYAEFTRKGKLFRAKVANCLPLLTSGRYVCCLDKEDYIIYEKTANKKIERQILPGAVKHPEGWQCKEILLSIKNHMKPGTVQYDGKKTIVTGKAYFDAATGHKYIKNSDTTYAEFTRKGKLFRNKVANNLPLLTSGRHILDLDQCDYILYEKRQHGQTVRQILPTSDNHPRNWYAKTVLVSGKTLSHFRMPTAQQHIADHQKAAILNPL